MFAVARGVLIVAKRDPWTDKYVSGDDNPARDESVCLDIALIAYYRCSYLNKSPNLAVFAYVGVIYVDQLRLVDQRPFAYV